MTESKMKDAMELAIEAHKEGKLKEAEHHYVNILKSQPNHPDANHNLGVLNINLGKPEQALQFFLKALKANYSVPEFWASFVDTLTKLERFSDAEKALRYTREKGITSAYLDRLEKSLFQETKTKSNHKENTELKKYNENSSESTSRKESLSQDDRKRLANLYQTEKFNEVLIQSNMLKEKYPNSFFLHNICGVSYLALEQYEAAVKSYKQANAIESTHADVYSNMGVALRGLGDLDAAIENYQKALEIDPGYLAAYVNMGVAQHDKRQLDAAINSYKKALEIKPDYYDIYIAIGNIQQDKEDFEAAVDSYKIAASILPSRTEAYTYVAGIFEKTNRSEELSSWIEFAESVLKKLPSDLSLYKCQALFREKNFESANAILSSIEINLLDEARKRVYFEFKGKCSEKLDNFDDAYNSFEELNKLVKFGKGFNNFQPDKFFGMQKSKLHNLKKLHYKGHPAPSEKVSDFTPSFLIGFPRSGTTLLDTILRSHSLIEVVEEKPALPNALRALSEMGRFDLIESFPIESGRSSVTEVYSNELKKYVSDIDSDTLKIDKLPLNILNLHLTNWLFPKAKYILAVRHPLDSILSCWMQNFGLNPAMANMVDLDRIADLYCLSMKICKLSEEKFGLNIYRIRYEDLVSNMKGEATKLLSFLDLEWEESLADYRKTAISRGNIRTPSYAQVVQPLYRDATYRWKNYEKRLERLFPKIEPWVSEFGYEPLR